MLRGQITLEGRVPQALPHAVYDRVTAFLPWRLKAPSAEQVAQYEADRAKNPAKYEPRKVRDEALLVSPRGELANAVIYLEKAPKDWKPTPVPHGVARPDQREGRGERLEDTPIAEGSGRATQGSARATQPTLKAEADRFAPHVVLLQVGQSLELAQADAPRVDNFHWEPVRNSPFNIITQKDKPLVVEPKVLRFPEKVPMPIRSDINPWKKSYLLLLDHPFMAVTDAEGRFEIADLPAGTHEFKVWHERAGYLDKKLEVTVDDQPLKPLALAYPAERVAVRADAFMKDALNRSELSLAANWRDSRNEFSWPPKPDQKVVATIELHLKNTSDKPMTVKVPSGECVQRRESKLRDLTITLEPAANSPTTEITIPPHDVISLTQSDVQLDLTGLDAGYWQLRLKTPLHAAACYLPFWLDEPTAPQR